MNGLKLNATNIDGVFIKAADLILAIHWACLGDIVGEESSVIFPRLWGKSMFG